MSTPTCTALIVLTAALLAGPVHAVPEAQFQPAFATFMQAVDGNTAAIDKAADAFAALLKTEPTNPVLLAYSGSATSMKSNTTWLPWKKMAYAEDGLAQLDKALALLTPAHNAVVQNATPGQLEVKLVAANTFLALPEMFNRRERGVKLVKDLLANPALASTPKAFQASVQKAAVQAQLAGAAQ